MQESKHPSYLKGAAILVAASIFVKIVGIVYKIPLFNIVDEAGLGAFQTTYNVFNLIQTISIAGIPVALSRLISSANAKGESILAKRYFSVALPAFLIIGAAGMLFMFFFADVLAELMNNSLAAPGIRVLAPAVFFVCIISIYRGYAQGHEDMLPTAISQVVEVVCKAAIGIAVALWLVHLSYESQFVSAGAIIGSTIGLGLCVPLLIWYKRKMDRKLHLTAKVEMPDTDIVELPKRLSILKRIFAVSIPIALSASFMALITIIDNAIVLGRLQSWLVHTEEVVEAATYLVAQQGAASLSEALSQAAEIASIELYGIYALGLTIFTLPPSIAVPVSVSIIPAIAAALAGKRDGDAGVLMQSSVKVVNLIAMPASAGIMVLASPILMALYDYDMQLATTILTILGAASFFVCLQYITTAILQANGHERVALITFPIGAAVKITLAYILSGNPDFGIIGSPVGVLACFFTISMLNIAFIKAKVKQKPKFAAVFTKPLLCAVVMAAAAFSVYQLLYWLGSDIIGYGRWAVALYLGVAVLIGVAVYGVLIVATRTITMEDMKLVPRGERIAKLLRIKE